MNYLAVMGFSMVGVFMTLIMTKRMSAMTALILIPVVFAIGMGLSPQMGKWALSGVIKVAPTAIMMGFAILFFGLMIDTGLFDPLIKTILRIVKGDPVWVAVGSSILAMIVSLDGDGSTTYVVTCSAMLPVFRRIGMKPLILASLVVMQNANMNIIPWGGPTGRVLTVLHLEASDVFLPMVPGMIVGSIFINLVAYYWGKKERNRLGIINIDHFAQTTENDNAASAETEADKYKRPGVRMWINLAMVMVLMAGLLLEWLPLSILFMIGTGLALLVNYPRLQDQQARIIGNAVNALPVIAMALSAGVFVGIMTGSKMIDSMALALVAIIPESMGSHMPIITAIVSLPGTFFLTNDAFFFGVFPVLVKTAATYGISPEVMGRAALIGQGSHLLSPLVASTYLLVGLTKVEFGDFQRYALLPSVGISVLWLITALVLGLIPF